MSGPTVFETADARVRIRLIRGDASSAYEPSDVVDEEEFEFTSFPITGQSVSMSLADDGSDRYKWAIRLTHAGQDGTPNNDYRFRFNEHFSLYVGQHLNTFNFPETQRRFPIIRIDGGDAGTTTQGYEWPADIQLGGKLTGTWSMSGPAVTNINGVARLRIMKGAPVNQFTASPELVAETTLHFQNLPISNQAYEIDVPEIDTHVLNWQFLVYSDSTDTRDAWQFDIHNPLQLRVGKPSASSRYWQFRLPDGSWSLPVATAVSDNWVTGATIEEGDFRFAADTRTYHIVNPRPASEIREFCFWYTGRSAQGNVFTYKATAVFAFGLYGIALNDAPGVISGEAGGSGTDTLGETICVHIVGTEADRIASRVINFNTNGIIERHADETAFRMRFREDSDGNVGFIDVWDFGSTVSNGLIQVVMR